MTLPSKLIYNNISSFTNKLHRYYDCTMPMLVGRIYLTGNRVHHFMDMITGFGYAGVRDIRVWCLFRLSFAFYFYDNQLVCDCVDYTVYECLKAYDTLKVLLKWFAWPLQHYTERNCLSCLNTWRCLCVTLVMTARRMQVYKSAEFTVCYRCMQRPKYDGNPQAHPANAQVLHERLQL
jgi:hypothetical protein